MLRPFVAKVNFSFDPITVSTCDDANDLITRAKINLGKLEVLIDEVYSKMHLLKFMGLKIESKKSLVVLSALVDVRLIF